MRPAAARPEGALPVTVVFAYVTWTSWQLRPLRASTAAGWLDDSRARESDTMQIADHAVVPTPCTCMHTIRHEAVSRNLTISNKNKTVQNTKVLLFDFRNIWRQSYRPRAPRNPCTPFTTGTQLCESHESLGKHTSRSQGSLLSSSLLEPRTTTLQQAKLTCFATTSSNTFWDFVKK
jgi:hypothetical protein